ncbi:ergothioneine biosynthesis protein EgtB [Azospirillum argentinense]|uniref:Ergothioneine biosynthesis protein EgtB n=1 Tax=Azospirillum brasilense TaxID=192 RepID=A0A4D8Q4U5_AZOBR|nr:ergothioneine biosynthesis protein EgtB [Azospirillum argentinense]QCO01152.1 ergothioneine biosynthesis protein EgtB [Azospirillum argentinense]
MLKTAAKAGGLADRFRRVRATSAELAVGLSPEDQVVQSMPDASPVKWHLAHTTWFFETFLLSPNLPGYRPFDPAFGYLFNSYYEAVGARHPRPRRGLVTRPGVAEVAAYRDHVDAAMLTLLERGDAERLAPLVTLGLAHEEQHQELILMDLLHLFSCNPVAPAYRPYRPALRGPAHEGRWIAVDGGIVAVGHAGEGFAFDNEGPRHEVLLRPFRLFSRAVTNGEWLAFVEDGGYRNPALWLSDGWATVNAEGWVAPAYWRRGEDGGWREFTLLGEHPLDEDAPVCHVGFYEADAFARWAGKRLPTEAEWETAAGKTLDSGIPATGNTLGSGLLRPVAAAADEGFAQMFGDVWEWTASAYSGYPGFRPAVGAVGEYNGKFMANQYVLRGGCCATPDGHARATYRNFFYPHQRWMFSGVRLAEDA